MASLLKDIKFALRAFAKRPAFTAVVVLTLGIGIGSNAAIFSVANAVLFEPLPFGNPEELVLIWNRLPNANVERALVSGPDFLDYQNETTQFEGRSNRSHSSFEPGFRILFKFFDSHE